MDAMVDAMARCVAGSSGMDVDEQTLLHRTEAAAREQGKVRIDASNAAQHDKVALTSSNSKANVAAREKHDSDQSIYFWQIFGYTWRYGRPPPAKDEGSYSPNDFKKAQQKHEIVFARVCCCVLG